MTDADTAVENTSASIASTPVASGVTFLRHGEQVTQQLDWEKGPEQVRKALAEALGAQCRLLTGRGLFVNGCRWTGAGHLDDDAVGEGVLPRSERRTALGI